MKPILFDFGFLPVYSYGFMLMLGFITGMIVAYPKLIKHNIRLQQLIDIAMLAVLAGIIGGRIFFVLQFPEHFTNHWAKAFSFWEGGLVFHGGLICSTIVLVIYIRYHRWHFTAVADILIISVAIALSFARIGCFLNGCCYGIECSHGNSSFAVQFPAQSIPGQQINLRGINVHQLWKYHCPLESQRWLYEADGRKKILQNLKENLPAELYVNIFRPIYATQLISSVKGLLLFLILFWYYPRRRYDGEVVLLFGMLYGPARFAIELIRADTGPIWGTGYNDGQLFSIALFLICTSIWLEIALRTKFLAWRKNKIEKEENNRTKTESQEVADN